MATAISTSRPPTPTDGGRPELTSKRWHKVREILAELLSYPGEERAAHLEQVCGDDRGLRRLVVSFLEADPRIDDFFEQGARLPAAESSPAQALPATEDAAADGGRPGAAGAGSTAAGGDLVGRRIGPYKVVRLLSKGGMGAVYLAEREGDFQKWVALKVIRRGKANDETVHWFHNERQILAKLEHPNIAGLLDGGTTDEGLPYLVMEYIDGETIDEYCDQRRLSLKERLELYLNVCKAVHFAHQKLVVHCDLKPGNILIASDGIPKIVDFGIARLLQPERAETPSFFDVATALRTGPLTPDYASPEQLLGFRMSTVSDVYSLGVVLYLLLTGHLPYNIQRHEDMERLIFRERPRLPSAAVYRSAEIKTGGGADARAEPERVSQARGCTPKQLSRRITGDLDHIVLRAMSRDPDRRYGSAAQLAEDIRRHLEHQPVTARHTTFAYRAGKFMRRNKLALATATVVLALLVGFALATTVLWRRAEAERRQAVQAAELQEDLLRLFGPHQTEGTMVRKKEVLDRGRARLAELAADSELRASLAGAIGRVYQGLGQHQSAQKLLEESIRIRRRLHPGGHRRLARTLDDLGELLYDLDQVPEAERLFREALTMERQLNAGEETAASLQMLNNRASALVSLGENEEAESLFREVLSMQRQLLGEDHESLILTRNNLAHVLAEQALYEEAAELYRAGLERRTELYGSQHPETANSLSSLGTVLYALGSLEEAEKVLREAEAIRRESFGDEDQRVATSLNNLGLVLHARGKLEEAESAIRAALDIRRKLGSKHRGVAVAERNLAALLVTRGQPRDAEPLVLKALDTLRAKLSPDHWRIADAESVLGSCRAALGRYEEAEPLLLRGYHSLRESRGEKAIYTRLARGRLQELYASKKVVAGKTQPPGP